MSKRKSKPEKASPKKKAGRPSIYTEALTARICAEIACGGNLHQICQRDDMPDRDTIYSWLRNNKAFSDNYTRAREDRADWRSDRIDEYVRKMVDGEIDANVARVAIDAEKWQAGKEKPKRYGDKLELSGDKDNPLILQMAEARKAVDAKIERLIAGSADEA